MDRSWEYINIVHRHMNVEMGAKAAQLQEKEYINGIFLQCESESVDAWLEICWQRMSETDYNCRSAGSNGLML